MDVVYEIIAECCEMVELEDIRADSRIMEDLNVSSMEFYSVIAELEAEFDIHISEREIQSMICIQDIMDLISKKVGDK